MNRIIQLVLFLIIIIISTIFYKIYFSDNKKVSTKVNIIDDHKINEEKLNNLKKSIKSKISNKIDNKKNKIKKIYSDPKSIPKEVKKQIKTGIQEKKDEIKSIYHEPDEVLTVQRIGKWGAIQLVKAFIGMPIVPGR